LHVCWQKQKICVIHAFRKYRLKTIYSGTNFSSFLDFRVILSITAQSIFALEPSVWARWKGILRENITKIKNKKNNNNNFLFFYLGSLKIELPKILIFNIFQI
jgi:hypothetical protein